MKKLDIRPIIEEIKENVKKHELERAGAYKRWLWQDAKGTRSLDINEYGCADAMNILYSLNEFHCNEELRLSRISALQSLQNEETGMFSEATHHTIHTTAHCTAALELFDARPLYPLKNLHKYYDKNELYALLDGLDWNNPWPQSHQGAGVYAALANADELTEEFQKNYFSWFSENADSISGFWKKGYAEKAPYAAISHPNGWDSPDSIFAYMAGGFHYLFNHEYAKMPLRFPEKVIDSCIKMYQENGIRGDFGRNVGFLEIDWVYCLNRATRQTTHRFDEAKACLWDFAEKFIDYLSKLDYTTDEGFNDLHMLFGCVCALAELQTALPGLIISKKPLRLVLDRRPFI